MFKLYYIIKLIQPKINKYSHLSKEDENDKKKEYPI
ncbi:MAG: hypothetical protein MRERC_1c168 [Mycoplasmataceae bacterium RC_NB112A]|nr:MAG: hypothetical protein MRERC_1c168 [Mycoplasmataceae bacterium RC_NB112A]